MAWGKRRGSTSSIETNGTRSPRWRSEGCVLSAAPPETWPESRTFELKDAIVLDKFGLKLANALDVHEQGPFIVRGTMLIDSADQREHLLSRVKSSVPIEIPICSRFSIGDSYIGGDGDDEDEEEQQGESGGPRPKAHIIWLAGQGGWFEIDPAPEYRQIHRETCEAIKLFYTLSDIYEEEGAPKLNRAVKSTDPIERLSPVFHKYSVRAGDGSTIEDVARRCNNLAGFFFSQFLDNPQNLEFWKRTFFYRWLKGNHEELYNTVLRALQRPSHICPSPRSSPLVERRGRSRSTTGDVPPQDDNKTSRDKSPEVEYLGSVSPDTKLKPTSAAQGPRTMSAAPSQQVLASRPRQTSVQSTMQNTPENQTALESLVQALDATYELVAGSKRSFTKSGILNKLYFNYRFPNYRNSQTGSHKIPVEEILHYNAAGLLSTIDKAKYDGTDFYEWLKELAATEFQPTAMKHTDFPFRIVPRQSRPAQSKSSTKAAKDNDDVVMSSEHSGPTPRGKGLKTPGRTPAKSGLRLVTSSRKRLHSDLESDSESPSVNAAKRSHYFTDGEEEEDDDMEDANNQNPQEEQSGSDDDRPVQIVIRAERLPPTVAKGPHNTWTCDEENCDYVVRGGDDEDCQKRIREHFEDHEQQEARVQLARTESRGHMPINHLLEKIKNLGEKASQDQPRDSKGAPLPQPIKRNLIV